MAKAEKSGSDYERVEHLILIWQQGRGWEVVTVQGPQKLAFGRGMWLGPLNLLLLTELVSNSQSQIRAAGVTGLWRKGWRIGMEQGREEIWRH